ncbi:MAG: HsdM family class I SAM-dependent methyltransferase [Janthinobacterium lividum]
MFGIDEDLNGRLFETFLSAIMRGQALGQYFTPRSVAKLITRLASPKASRNKVDRVLDACCGTGGFLIEALTDMRNEINANSSLTKLESENLKMKVANDSIYGVDIGKDPPVARIARINMYLHGDGGSRIFVADSLDKAAVSGAPNDPQSKRELEEWRTLVEGIAKGKAGIKEGAVDGFDIVLSNPPFSLDLLRNCQMASSKL